MWLQWWCVECNLLDTHGCHLLRQGSTCLYNLRHMWILLQCPVSQLSLWSPHLLNRRTRHSSELCIITANIIRRARDRERVYIACLRPCLARQFNLNTKTASTPHIRTAYESTPVAKRWESGV
eukprot:COSAG02_NODE_3347_length_6896_cov_2.201854_3_plen_123_part_00